MTPHQNIRQSLIEAHARGLTADQAVDALRSHPSLFDFVRPLLLMEWQRVERDRVRTTERSLDGVWQRAQSTTSLTKRAATTATTAYIVPQELLVLQVESFSLADGTRVKWFNATIEQHQARVDMQRKLMGGIELDVHRHLEAIRVLRETGAVNLAALPSTCFQNV